MSKYSRKQRAKMNRAQKSIAGALSVYGSNIRTVEVEPEQPRETLASFTKKYNEEQEEARVAPIRRAERELTENLRRLRVEQRKALLISPSEELAEMCPAFQYRGEKADELLAAARAAFAQFKNDLQAEGITFTEKAGNKLAKISQLNLNLDWVNPTVVRQIFDYCDSLGLWDESEVIRHKAPAPTPESTYDGPLDIENLDTTSTESRRASESAINDYFYSREVGPVWEAWKSHMLRDYYFTPTEKQGRQIIDWFVKNSKSFLDTRNWDRMRVALREVFGPSPRTGQPMLTPDELLTLALDHDAFDLSSREGKSEFLKRSKLVQETTPEELRQQQDAAAEQERVNAAQARIEAQALIEADAIRRRVLQSARDIEDLKNRQRQN